MFNFSNAHQRSVDKAYPAEELYLAAEPKATQRVDANSLRDLTQHRAPLPALTGIRFFAAMQVVLFHFGATFAKRHGVWSPFTNLLANGWTAVTLFFMLSGFILSYTYSGQIEGPRGKSRFWEARFARIYPVYLLSLVLSLRFWYSPRPGLGIAVLGMVQAWNPLHPGYGGAWNMPAWTLSTEAFFYLLFPFILPVMDRCSGRALRIILLASLGLIVVAHTMSSSLDWLAARTFMPLPLFRVPEFLTGMSLGLIFLRGERVERGVAWTYGAFAAILIILMFVHGAWVSLLAIPFSIVIYQIASGSSAVSRMLALKPMVLLGGASYAIYLLQEPIRSWVHLAVSGSPVLTVNSGGVDAVISPLVLVGFSVAVFLLWEEPARKSLRRWFKGIPTPPGLRLREVRPQFKEPSR